MILTVEFFIGETTFIFLNILHTKNWAICGGSSCSKK